MNRDEIEGLIADLNSKAFSRLSRAARSAAAALRAQQERIDALEAWIANPPKHRYWRPGEPDCPKDIKAGNGELHTLRCKVCGLDDPREDICRTTLTGEKP